MEKKPKAAVLGKAPKKGKSRGGRPKERVQISVRIDRMVMDLVRAYLERNKKAHITDLLERGALLALREAEKLEPEFMNARIALNDVGVELARDVTDLWAMRYLAERKALRPEEAAIREISLIGLKAVRSVREWGGYMEALRMIIDPNVTLGDRDQPAHGMSKPPA